MFDGLQLKNKLPTEEPEAQFPAKLHELTLHQYGQTQINRTAT
jgi:hypothetical protein